MAEKEIVSEFDDIFSQPAILRTWPPQEKTETWTEALRLAGASSVADELKKCAKTVHACIPMAGYPIVGVLGQLNAGKSSVVASFISETGQARLPRGLHDGQGTHRFVYWLPQKWRDESDIWEAFRTLLDRVHGPQIEYLDDDPSKAAAQYGSGLGKPDIIRRPLIAFDKALNDQGFALLDCPDVQTRDEGAPLLTAKLNPRVEFVCNAAKVCSAFLYIWEASKLNEDLFTDLLQELSIRIPGVPLLLLVNKIKPFQGEPTRTRECRSLQTATGSIGIDPNKIYGAFDHDIAARKDATGTPQPGWTDLTPPLLVQRHQEGRGTPQFFSLAVTHAENNPHAVDKSRFLHNALKDLPSSELQQTHLRAIIKSLMDQSRLAVAELRKFVTDRTDMAQHRQSQLLAVAEKVFTDPRTKQPTQLPDPQLLTALRDSIIETAPLIIRALMNARSWTQEWITVPLKNRVRGLFKRPDLLGDKGLEESDTDGSIKMNFYSSRDIALELMALRWFPTGIKEAQVMEAIGSAFKQVRQSATENPCLPPKSELDKHTSHIWSQIKTTEAFYIAFWTFMGIFGELTVLGGLVLTVIDGGATILGTISIANLISSQLVLTVASIGQVFVTFNDLDSSLIRFNSIPSVSRLFANLCDVFGVPRPNNFSKLSVTFGTNKEKITYSLVDPAIPTQPAVCSLGDQSLWTEQPSVQRLEKWVSNHD